MKLIATSLIVIAAFASCKKEATEEYPGLSQGYAATPVDLGLSVKWADHNLGALNGMEGGYFFMFGSTVPYKKEQRRMYSYNPPGDYSIAGDTDHDPAAKYWGGNWRMPTNEQFKELREECTWESPDGRGFLITGPNGNTIYLPAPGTVDHPKMSNGGFYWTATTSKGGTPLAYGLSGYNVFFDNSSGPKNGFAIRPVWVE